jgi:hypothetical protein
MVLKNSLLSVLSLAAAAQAAVTFYGSKGAQGDIVKCADKNITDDRLSLIFGTIYPGYFLGNTSDFQFDDPMTCGSSDAVMSIEFNCEDLGAKTTCIPHNRTTKHSGQSRSMNTIKRDDSSVKCDQYSGQCKDQYQSSGSSCQSGYSREFVETSGYSASVWCTKKCTEDQAINCSNTACTEAKNFCEKAKSIDACTSAIVKCRGGSPVKMSQDRCNEEYLNRGGDLAHFCKTHNMKCLEYKDGACSLDASTWDAYLKNVEQSYYQSSMQYYPPPDSYYEQQKKGTSG